MTQAGKEKKKKKERWQSDLEASIITRSVDRIVSADEPAREKKGRAHPMQRPYERRQKETDVWSLVLWFLNFPPCPLAEEKEKKKRREDRFPSKPAVVSVAARGRRKKGRTSPDALGLLLLRAGVPGSDAGEGGEKKKKRRPFAHRPIGEHETLKDWTSNRPAPPTGKEKEKRKGGGDTRSSADSGR